MNKKPFFSMLSAAIGGALMFFFDPDTGKRRRALVRDKIVSFRHRAADRITASAKDVRNRAIGVAARTRRLFDRNKGRDEKDEAASGSAG
jgi:hypothetical protein